MSNQNYSRDDVARIFIDAYTEIRGSGYTDDRSEIARSTLYYLIGYFGITEQFVAAVPGFDHLTAGVR